MERAGFIPATDRPHVGVLPHRLLQQREVQMSMPTLLLMVGLLYTLLVGLLAYLRREGLSAQFAIESIAITIFFSGLATLTNFVIPPFLFLIILYIVTMRVRLLVDLANSFAGRARFDTAEKIYAFISRLWPDSTGRLIVEINRGVICLRKGFPDEAIRVFKDVLEQAGQGRLGVKYRAAAHYNLGQAYRRKQMEAQAIAEFNAVLDTWPASEYARRARSILAHNRDENMPASEEEDSVEDQQD
jgi:tetratricopeptide (TPR) repeat protein